MIPKSGNRFSEKIMLKQKGPAYATGTASTAPAVSTMSRWMPPQRVQRMVQYSQPPRPARPGMIFSTARLALHSGQAERAGRAEPAGSVRGIGRSLTTAQPDTVDMALGVGDRRFRIVPGKADVEG